MSEMPKNQMELKELSPGTVFSVRGPLDGELIAPSQSGLVGEKLTLEAFWQLCGKLGGTPFVKVVWDREKQTLHFISNARHAFHADYIGTEILQIPNEALLNQIDEFNRDFYQNPERRFCLGIVAFHDTSAGRKFFTLETVEVDTMGGELLLEFFQTVGKSLDPLYPFLLKPANHHQETLVGQWDPREVPRIFNHELNATAQFIALNAGKTTGRLRIFPSEEAYRAGVMGLEWFDIVVMNRVPDDIPRVSGMINSHYTTPLSHTNVLATGWQIPNCIQLGIVSKLLNQGLDKKWVEFEVDSNAEELHLKVIDQPVAIPPQPAWKIQQVKLEEPETAHTPILGLGDLRVSDRFRYGTKAANLGELKRIVESGSSRLVGFYRVPRPPRANLMPYLAKFLQMPTGADLDRPAWEFLKKTIRIPRGIAIPFSVQREFLESSPSIQQQIGRLKMALELNAREVDPICLRLQQMIRSTRMSDSLRDRIDAQIAYHLSGVSSFVVRSSSNAEDLENFSAAGIYESKNHVTTADKIFESIKEVWASLVSPRSVRLRQEVGISLDDSYMGVIVQEEVASQMGGVLVTTNPMNRGNDFRNVYINVSPRSAQEVVEGHVLPYQYLYNTVEGGGRTLSLGSSTRDLPTEKKTTLQALALVGRLLQSHFSPNYTFSTPVDIEWAADDQGLYILQLRPYSH